MAKEKKVKKNQAQAGTIKLMDSVKTKLILIMALLVAVPLLVAIIISYQSSTSKAHEDALELLSATVSSLANSADDLKDIAVKLNEEISFFKDDTE